MVLIASLEQRCQEQPLVASFRRALCFAGMADLMSPFVVLSPDNADAFWCFERLMRRVVRRELHGSLRLSHPLCIVACQREHVMSKPTVQYL